MEKEIKKASEITSSFKDRFSTSEAIDARESYTSKPYINRTDDKEDKISPINIEYFENKTLIPFDLKVLREWINLKMI